MEKITTMKEDNIMMSKIPDATYRTLKYAYEHNQSAHDGILALETILEETFKELSDAKTEIQHLKFILKQKEEQERRNQELDDEFDQMVSQNYT